jgi:hypothetical protein
MIAGRVPAPAFVIAFLVGACVTGPTPSGPPVGSPIASSTSDVIATTDPAEGWQLASLPDPNTAVMFSDVAAGPDGFLVAGGGGPVGNTAIVLNSEDGQTWSSEAISGSFAAPFGLNAVGARVFAVGGGETNRCAHPAALTTWAREVSGRWQEAPFDDVFCAGLGNATLFAFDRHVVLAGAGTGDQSFYMTSEDGLRWADAGPNPFGDIYPHSFLAWDKDLWIFGSAPNGAPVVVHRSAGKPFDLPARLPGFGVDGSIIAAVWLDNGPVVVASIGGVAGVLRPDGSGSWVGVPGVGLPPDQVARIAVVDGHLVALGGTDDGLPELWASTDGAQWMSVVLPEQALTGSAFSGVAVIGGTAVLVGQRDALNGTGAVGAIWTGPASLLAP